jgi:hypothetical protein
MGKRVGSMVEWRGGERRRHAASVRLTEAEEVMRWGTGGCFQKKLQHKREGGGAGRVRVKP